VARSLDQIIAELDTTYNPQRQSIQNQIGQLAPQQQAQEQGLEAQKTDAFDSIVSGARQRGIGFGGIPLGEQAKYTASSYLPALANLKQSFNQQRTGLGDALNNLGIQQNQYAQQIRQAELDRDETARQFNEAHAAAARAAAAQSAASNSWLGALGGGQSPRAAASPAASRVDPLHQRAYNAVQDLLGTNNKALIQKTYAAINKSAGYGNAYDKVKLQLLSQLAPNLFGGRVSANALGNGGQLRF
jgi:hypothetical protein